MQETLEMRIGRWEDRRDLKNLMGRYMYDIMYYQQKELFDRYWAGRDDVSLGVNDGFYTGAEEIRAYYQAASDYIAFQSGLMRHYFPNTLGGKTDEEVFGIGPLEFKPMSMPIIAVADDGVTAKGMWYSRGSYARLTRSGPTAYWTWGVFCVDFVREADEWKIWHLLYLEDINHIAGQDWAKPETPFPDEPGFERAEDFRLPEPSVKRTNRALYTQDRPFTKLPPFPTAYKTFAETFSYGI